MPARSWGYARAQELRQARRVQRPGEPERAGRPVGMAHVDEDVLDAGRGVDDRARRMEAVSVAVEVAAAAVQRRFQPPLGRLPVGRVDAPQVDAHRFTLGTHHLQAAGQRVEVQVDRVDAPAVAHVGALRLHGVAGGAEAHLHVIGAGDLVAADHPQVAVVEQGRRLVLRRPVGQPVIDALPGAAAVTGAEHHQERAAVVSRSVHLVLGIVGALGSGGHVADGVAEGQQAVLGVIDDARPQVDDVAGGGVLTERLAFVFPGDAAVFRPERTVVAENHDGAVAAISVAARWIVRGPDRVEVQLVALPAGVERPELVAVRQRQLAAAVAFGAHRVAQIVRLAPGGAAVGRAGRHGEGRVCAAASGTLGVVAGDAAVDDHDGVAGRRRHRPAHVVVVAERVYRQHHGRQLHEPVGSSVLEQRQLLR